MPREEIPDLSNPMPQACVMGMGIRCIPNLSHSLSPTGTAGGTFPWQQCWNHGGHLAGDGSGGGGGTSPALKPPLKGDSRSCCLSRAHPEAQGCGEELPEDITGAAAKGNFPMWKFPCSKIGRTLSRQITGIYLWAKN